MESGIGTWKRLTSIGVAALALVVVAGCGSGNAGRTAEGPPPGGGETDGPGEVPADGPEANDALVLDAGDSGVRVFLEPGEVLAIRLTSNPSTGYGWRVVEVDAEVLEQVADVEFSQAPEDRPRAGAPGLLTLRFTARNSGRTTLRLVYDRSWQEGSALETFEAQVVVR